MLLHRWVSLSLYAFSLIAILPFAAEAQTRDCDTALSRIARKAAEKALQEHRGDVCSGLRLGPIGIDKTKALELRAFELCERGPLVSASITVFAKCSTSEEAIIQTQFGDQVNAKADANLDTCQVLTAQLNGGKFVTEAVIKAGELERKAKEVLEREIRPYCK